MEYTGGPALARLAEEGNPKRFQFPRPMTDRPGLDFSFSGLKTFALNIRNSSNDDQQTRADIARAFQDAVVDTFAIKCRRALRQTGLKRLVVAGGVSANKQLRARLVEIAEQEQSELFFPRLEFCTDNGAMIALAGYFRLSKNQQEGLAFNVRPRWPLDTLT